MKSESSESEAGAPDGREPRAASGVRDRRIERVVALTAPDALLDELPLTVGHEEVVLRGRRDIHSILDGSDDRLLVVAGPCSVHDIAATLDYAGRLREVADALSEDLLIAMRVYFEKPRTTTGWKGLINDPHIDGSGDVNTGLRMARRVLLGVLETGLCAGCEFLDPITPQYISDAVSWGAIGARTTESQIHRQLASGLSMPVGFKNRTDGNIAVAVDAVRAAVAKHAFAGIDSSGRPAILYTSGNPDCHVILRGGRGTPNYDAESVAQALAQLRAAGLAERLVVDASHDNSGKDHERQREVVEALATQIAAGNASLRGLMLESFILGGRQEPDTPARLTYGQSITDACMSWNTTEHALQEIAEAVQRRRTV